MKNFLGVFMMILCVSCISDNENSKTLSISAESRVGEVYLYVVPTNFETSFDSLTLKLPNDGSILKYEWNPNLDEGTFVFGVVGSDELERSIGYFTNGRITPNNAFHVTVYADSIHIQ